MIGGFVSQKWHPSVDWKFRLREVAASYFRFVRGCEFVMPQPSGPQDWLRLAQCVPT